MNSDVRRSRYQLRRTVVASVLACSLATVVALSAATGSNAASSNKTAGSSIVARQAAAPTRGGTYKVAFDASFGFTDNLDPTGEYALQGWDIFSLLVRTLVGYDHLPSNQGGDVIVADIARAVPKPTNGGLKYTFHLKHGIRFGPPVNRAITSRDVVYAMDRLANPKDGAEYASYYTVIKGWNAYAAGKAKTISGISTPNPYTITFRLTQPTGDFLERMALPATGPMPESVAKCFSGGNASAYGRDVISTAGYMIKGIDSVDISSCKAIKPAVGFNPLSSLTLVRNPNYSPATASSKQYSNYPDSFTFTVDTNDADIFSKVSSGQFDDELYSNPPPAVLRQYETTPSLKPLLKVSPVAHTKFLTLNLTQPPFDDIHVRKALNYVINKQALRQVFGGPVAGAIGTNIIPNDLVGNRLAKFDPYKTPGEEGSVSLAKKAMGGSKYDTGHNGMCDAPACKNVLLVADSISTDQAMLPTVIADAAKIGITFKVRTIASAYPAIETPKDNIPISVHTGWGADYLDPYTYMDVYYGNRIVADGNINWSLIGITPSVAKHIGVTGVTANIPNVDSKINRCESAHFGSRRLDCWVTLDRYMMTKVVPIVPWLQENMINIVSSNVTNWTFDDFSELAALAHVAVKS